MSPLIDPTALPDLAVQDAVGTRSFYADNPIQRFHRDISSLATHALFDFDNMANLYGAVRVGLDLPKGAMV